jgi:hypothetical protein
MSLKSWDVKTQEGASDFDCLKDKWARFECKSGSNFWFYIWGQTQGVQIIEEASQWGVRRQRERSGPHCGTRSRRVIMGGYYESWGVPASLKYLRTAQGTRESVVTEF